MLSFRITVEDGRSVQRLVHAALVGRVMIHSASPFSSSSRPRGERRIGSPIILEKLNTQRFEFFSPGVKVHTNELLRYATFSEIGRDFFFLFSFVQLSDTLQVEFFALELGTLFPPFSRSSSSGLLIKALNIDVPENQMLTKRGNCRCTVRIRAINDT
jgi:hypothetical protein